MKGIFLNVEYIEKKEINNCCIITQLSPKKTYMKIKTDNTVVDRWINGLDWLTMQTHGIALRGNTGEVIEKEKARACTLST